MVTLEIVKILEKCKNHSKGLKITPKMSKNHSKRVIFPKGEELTEGHLFRFELSLCEAPPPKKKWNSLFVKFTLLE